MASHRVDVLVGHLEQNSDEKNQVAPSVCASEDTMYGGLLAAQALIEQNVSTVFTLTGGHISPILVGCNARGIKVLDVRDEANTVFAADAMSRISGTIGVAIVTAGPGLTNTITAVKNAQLAESPVIILGGATVMLLKNRGSLQDIDQMALMRPHVKWMSSIEKVKDIIPTLRKAFQIAQEGVPGPVFVEFPIETIWPAQVMKPQLIPNEERPKLSFSVSSVMKWLQDAYLRRHFNKVFNGAFDPVTAISQYVVKHPPVEYLAVSGVLHRLRTSKKPVLLIGSQTVHPNQTNALIKAVETLKIPTYLSGMGRGLLGKNHPLHMKHKRSRTLGACDFVIFAGVPPDFRVNYGQHLGSRSFFVMANLSEETLAKNSDMRKRDITIHGDPHQFLVQLAEASAQDEPLPEWNEWITFLNENMQKREDEIDRMAAEAYTFQQGDGAVEPDFVHPIRCCRVLDKVIDDDSILVTDGGDFIGTASYTVRPRAPLTWLDPGVFGTLGVGAGFAMACKISKPSSEVWLLYGDGACGWSIMEFDTFCRHGIPVIAVVGNDACWSQMHRDQVRILGDPVATELEFTHYEKVAEGFGAEGILVRKDSELEPAFMKAKQLAREGRPVLVNVLLMKSKFREGSISL